MLSILLLWVNMLGELVVPEDSASSQASLCAEAAADPEVLRPVVMLSRWGLPAPSAKHWTRHSPPCCQRLSTSIRARHRASAAPGYVPLQQRKKEKDNAIFRKMTKIATRAWRFTLTFYRRRVNCYISRTQRVPISGKTFEINLIHDKLVTIKNTDTFPVQFYAIPFHFCEEGYRLKPFRKQYLRILVTYFILIKFL